MIPADATPLCPVPHLLVEPAPSSPGVPPSFAADDPELLAKTPSATARALAQRDRRPPLRRRNRTSEARVGQGHKVHLTIDLDDAGRPCGIWVAVHKEGSAFRGMLDTLAAVASGWLQEGASIHAVARRMRGVRFEPDGEVHGHETITSCTSLVDLLGQMLLAEFPAKEGR